MNPRQKKAKPNSSQYGLVLREPGQPTVGEVCMWYLRHHVEGPDMGFVTKRGYRSTLRMYQARFGRTAVPSVGEVREWLSRRLTAGEISPLTANSHRDRLHAVYVLYQQQARAITLNPFTFRRFKEDDRRHLRGDMDAPGKTWAAMLAACPDDRARAFVSLAGRMGWRKGDLLGLEWRHVHWKAPGGVAMRREQQRRAWDSVPGELKHGGLVGTYSLHTETAEYLKRARRELGKATTQLGCVSGALVGTEPGKDGGTRQFIFPYREEHVDGLMKVLRTAAPKEFPKGQAWHRLRRFATVVMVRAVGIEEAKRLRGDAYISTTQAYCQQVVGVSATAQDLAKLYAAQDRVLSDAGDSSDNVDSGFGQSNQAVEGSAI